MSKQLKNKILSLVLCFVIGFTAAACASRAEPSESGSIGARENQPSSSGSSKAPTGDGKTFMNTLELPEGPFSKFEMPKLTEQVNEKHKQNSDTVGWLQVPGTTIDDVVVWYPKNNNYYYRRGFDKNYSFNGVFWADYRCKFDGGTEGLAPNTVLYGHSLSDDPMDKNKLFSPTKLFKDEEFAKETPYIYFSLADQDLVWEVFAVFFATVELPYNIPFPQDFAGIVSECVKRSIYTYDTQVTASDKILTLSTCIYALPDGTPIAYPNNYRYVVMAKLVTDTSKLKNEAAFTVNPSPKAP